MCRRPRRLKQLGQRGCNLTRFSLKNALFKTDQDCKCEGPSHQWAVSGKMHNTGTSKVTLQYTYPILPYLWWCRLSCCMACYFLFPCYLSSSSCFLFSPLFLLLVIPCSPLPPLHFVFCLSIPSDVLSWAGATLDFGMKCSVTGHIAFMQNILIAIWSAPTSWRLNVTILKPQSQEKMKSCIFLTFFLNFFYVSI